MLAGVLNTEFYTPSALWKNWTTKHALPRDSPYPKTKDQSLCLHPAKPFSLRDSTNLQGFSSLGLAYPS